MKYLFVCVLMSSVLYSCNNIGNQAMRIIYDDSVDISALETTPSIIVDTLQLKNSSEEVKSFYEKNEYKLGWDNANNRKQLVDAIYSLQYDGIKIAKYNIDILEGYHKRYETLSNADKIKADIYFSNAYTKAIDHLLNGMLNARNLYNDWDIDRKELNPSSTMLLALSNEAISTTFDSVRPKQEIYAKYRSKLEQLYALEQDSLITFKGAKLNDTILSIVAVKKHLSFLNYLKDVDTSDVTYNTAIANSVKKYQTKNKLTPNGYLDDKTKQTILAEEEMIKKKLVVNLERWRWFPREFGEHYILVNIPDFHLVAVSNNDTVQKLKVVVGKPERKTPILSSKLTTVVINPTWTVPPTIMKNDLIPSAKANLGYFASRNFTIYNSAGKVVEPANWNSEKGTSYRYVQKGGVGNTLGRIKFMFNNNHAVYLHDTPSKWGFDKNQRGLSSGCVRVQNPFDLAQFVFDIEKTNLSKEKVQEVLESQKTSNYGTSKVPIEIHQLYWTVQVDNKGQITYFNDLYEYDDNLYSRLLN
ncbi:MAG: L,D-transpeptidase family protein [Flavobacteriaceae bacterium]|nr:L,D-transpeptidase family protein [Flavobacteriaceae bacterium]